MLRDRHHASGRVRSEKGMHFRLVSMASMVAVCLLLSGCWGHDVSGKYIAKFTNGVYWLQLVQTPDGHLTGQFETLILGTDGKVEYNNLSVTGAADGDNVSLSLKPISFLPFTVIVSGTFYGNRLALTGGFTGAQPTTAVMVRSDVSDYQAQVNSLNAQSRSILTAKATAEAREAAAKEERDFIAGLDRLVGRMERFNAAADTHLGKLPAAEHRYQAITFKMGEYLNRERQLAGNQGTSMKRGQISFAISRGSFATDQVHAEVQSVQWNFQANAQPLMKLVTESEQSCHRAHRSTADNPVSPDAEAWNSACLKLLDADASYRQKFDAMAHILAHLEEVYQQERKNQNRLVRESQQIE